MILKHKKIVFFYFFANFKMVSGPCNCIAETSICTPSATGLPFNQVPLFITNMVDSLYLPGTVMMPPLGFSKICTNTNSLF